MSGVSLTHPMLNYFLYREFLLHIPCWINFYVGSFSYTSSAAFIFIWGVSLTHPVALFSFYQGGSLTHRVLIYFLKLRSFSYTSPADFIFIWGASLTHPMLASFLSRQFLLHIQCWLHVYLGSFSYTSHASFTFLWGVSLTHPELASFFNRWSLAYTKSWGVSLTHLVLPSFISAELLLNISCWLHFYVGSFSFIPQTYFIFMWGVSLTHLELPSLFMRGVSLTHPVLCLVLWRSYWYISHSGFFFYRVSFTYTSRAGFIFISCVSLTDLILASFLSEEILLHISCWLHF